MIKAKKGNVSYEDGREKEDPKKTYRRQGRGENKAASNKKKNKGNEGREVLIREGGIEGMANMEGGV